MSKAVVVMFDSRREAEDAAQRLRDQGFERREIDIRSAAASPRADEAREGESSSWWEWLFGESEDRAYYKEGIERGGAVLTLTTSDERADRARRRLEAQGEMVEPEREAATAQPISHPVQDRRDEKEVIPVAEERLRVGKRTVPGRRVRVYGRVVERPIEEDVRLREERVHLERRPTDRPVEATDDAFRERVIELTESAEEVVVAKDARIVEEVVVGREVDERVETVRDSVRRTEVDVDNAGADEEFRGHWARAAQGTGVPYEAYAPAYGYGRQLAADSRYAGRDWADLEPDVRRDWEQRSPGTWDRFKEAIRHAWDKARDTGRRAA
jgi:uncharacterized protein (TIGR02271 family)